MKNRDIKRLYEGLCEISELKFYPKTSFILAKDKLVLQPYYFYINDSLKELLNKFGTLNKDGSTTILNEDMDLLNKEVDKLLDTDNNIIIDGILIEDLGNDLISINQLEKIIDIIKA